MKAAADASNWETTIHAAHPKRKISISCSIRVLTCGRLYTKSVTLKGREGNDWVNSYFYSQILPQPY